jgi:threonine/homoserine/homoserine lactone efflux protein
MLGTHSLALFAATVLVVNLTPGVDMMLTIAATLRHGVAGGLAAALGIETGCIVHTLLAAFGLAALLAASASAFAALKWAGAAYLVWLAVGMLRAGAAAPAATSDGERGGERAARGKHAGESARELEGSEPGAAAGSAAASPRVRSWPLFRQGVLTNVLNPKIAIFFLALLPQFIDAGAADKPLAFLFLGAWFVAQSALFLVAFVLLVSPLRRWRASAAWRRGLHFAGAAIFVWLAARLALVEQA